MSTVDAHVAAGVGVSMPSVEALIRLCSRIESDVHRAGWAGPPVALIVYDGRDQDTVRAYQELFVDFGWPVRVGDVMARPMLPLSRLLPSPAIAVYRLALRLAGGLSLARPEVERPEWLSLSMPPDVADELRRDVANYVRVVGRPGFIGAILVGRSWHMPAGSRDEAEAWARDPRDLADIPGAIESRWLAMVDRWGRALHCIRERGGKPVVGSSPDGATGEPVPESLALIAAALAGVWPLPALTTEPRGWGPSGPAGGVTP